MSYFPIARSIREFASRFTEAGFSIYIVGGAVRDFFLHRPVTDYDFATDAEPQEVMGLFRSVVPTGIKHGTVTVLYKGRSHEVTTFRLDGTYGDHRHPDTVHFVRSLDEDLKRRDFTINALAIDASNGTLVDHHQGMEDLKAKTIRAIGMRAHDSRRMPCASCGPAASPPNSTSPSRSIRNGPWRRLLRDSVRSRGKESEPN